MTGKEKAGRVRLQLRHQLLETSVANVVLRDGTRLHNNMPKPGLTTNAEEFLQIGANEFDQFVLG